MKKIVLLIAIKILTAPAYAQSAKEQLALANAAQLNTKDFYKEMTFEDRFGYFIIPVRIGDGMYEYIFDTAGYNTLTSDILDKNQFPRLMQVQVGSSNQVKSKIAITKIPSLSIADIEFRDIGAFNFDFDDSPQIKCYTNGGLIGKSIIREAIWQINAPDKKIIVTDNIGRLDNLDNAVKIKVRFDKTLNPFIKAKINGKTETFLLDFGYGGLLSLTEKDGEKYAAGDQTEITGEGSVGANGMLQESTFITGLQSFAIGETNIPAPVAYYSKSNNYNLIGTALTKYFIVTLNLKASELYLTPLEGTYSAEKEESFGFDLNREKDTIYISKIYKGLPADKGGLKLQDIILRVNGQDLKDVPYCDFYFRVKSFLKEESEIKLELKHNHEIEVFTLNKGSLLRSH